MIRLFSFCLLGFCCHQALNASTPCERFLKDNAEFVKNASAASCLDSASLLFTEYYAPYDVHIAEIQKENLASHFVFRCRVGFCKNEGMTWDMLKQKNAEKECIREFTVADSAKCFSSFKKFIRQIENLDDRKFDSLYLANDLFCNLYQNDFTRLFTRPFQENGYISVKNDSVLYVQGNSLSPGLFLSNFKTGNQRKIYGFFHRTEDGFALSGEFRIVESSDSSYRVEYAGGDIVYYDGKDSTSFVLGDTSGFWMFIQYKLNGDSVLYSNAPEYLENAESYRMPEATAHRYLLKMKRYRIPSYGTDTSDNKPLFRKEFPFYRIDCFR